MAKIAYVKAWGLWSHLETVLEFSPGLTVITGPNGNGKSTLIRIIKWVALGEPTGEDFIFKLREEKTGAVIKEATEGKAEIGLDNGVVITKTRRKGKTTYTLNTIPEPFEKAEVPQEVKDALGIKKYTFGDFVTYLNFAFQMEAPFLLSESPSVGAKVLGKLAGTEVVDLATADISKRTHKAREEKRSAEKTISNIAGDLLDYLDLDDAKAALGACEFLLAETETAATRKDYLNSLVYNLNVTNDMTEKLTASLKGLEGVPGLIQDLQQIEKDQQRYNLLLDLFTQLGGINKSTEELTAQLASFVHLDTATQLLYEVDAQQRKLNAITSLSTDYANYTQVIKNTRLILDNLNNIDVAAADLAIVEKQSTRLTALKQLQGQYNISNIEISTITNDLSKLQELKTADALLGMHIDAYDRLQILKDLQAQYKHRQLVYDTIADELHDVTVVAQTAQTELNEAWQAAGGICPLCDSPIATHSH